MQEQRIPFTQEDEERIASAAIWGKIVAVTGIVSSGLGAVIAFATQGFVALFAQLFFAVPLAVIPAIWMYQASEAFSKVALTDEADEHYLLLGFTKLRNYFMFIGVLIIIMISLVALGFFFALTCGLMFGLRR